VTKDAQTNNWPETSYVAIVTTDEKLCKKVAHSANICVAVLHPVTYLLIMRKYGLEPNTPENKEYAGYLPLYGNKGEKRPVLAYYVDTGSLAAHLSRLDEVKSNVYKRTLNYVGTKNGRRNELYTLTPTTREMKYEKTWYPYLNERRIPKLSKTSSYRKAYSQGSTKSGFSNTTRSGVSEY